MATLPANPIQALIRKLPRPLQNKYYLTLVVFFFWLIFIDRNNWWSQFKLIRAVRQLEADKAYYQQKIEEVKLEAEHFEEMKEKYAREHYFMKRRDEDVFIIQEPKLDQ